jgi:hypothetical protein
MKAFWTYRTTNQEFESQVVEIQKMCNKIKMALQELAVIPIFSKDPFTMTPGEFALYYEETKVFYLGHSIVKEEIVENNSHKLGKVLNGKINPSPQNMKENKLLEKKKLNEKVKD